MTAAGTWALIIGLAVATYALRLSFIQAWQWIRVPAELERALRYVPPAVLAALVVPALAVSEGSIALGPENLRLIAGTVAAAVAWYSGNVILTLAVGMGGLWLLEALL